MPRLLILINWFTPGYRAGGPITSCQNLVEALSSNLEIYVLTSDRDLNDQIAYPNVVIDQWIDFAPNVKVCYLSPKMQTPTSIKQYILDAKAEVIYLNSLFSTIFTIYPLWLKWSGHLKEKIVLAPRGMLRSSALQFKPFKKKIFLQLLNAVQLHNWVQFHATDSTEFTDIKQHLGQRSQIALISNYPLPVNVYKQRKKQPTTRFLFLGRIHPIKGLLETLRFLKEITVPLQLSIIGSKEIEEYWQKCQLVIEKLPKHLDVNFLGELPPSRVRELLMEHDFLILPTKGENFGHAIFEALSTGLPIIISDQTPWKNLQNAGIGWDIPVNDFNAFINAITEATIMSSRDYSKMSKAAWQYARDFIDHSQLSERYLEMFGFKEKEK